MSKVLKIKTKRLPHKLVGISVPLYTHEFLTLYSLAKGITKTDIFRPWINDWIRGMRVTETDEVLVLQLVEKLKEKRRFDEYLSELEWTDFITVIGNELKKTNLKDAYIQVALSKLNEGHK